MLLGNMNKCKPIKNANLPGLYGCLCLYVNTGEDILVNMARY